MAANLGGAIGGAVGVMLTTWLVQRIFAAASGARSPERAPGSSLTLRHPPILAFIGVLGVAMALGAGAFAWGARTSAERWLGIASLALFGFFGFLLLAAGLRVRFVFDADRMREHTWRGAVHELAWADVASVEFSTTWGYLTLRGARSRVRASPMMMGFGDLWLAIEERVPQALWADARARCDAYAARMSGR